MRIVKYPETEVEKFCTCHCGAELAYTSADISWKDTLVSHIKIVICPVCGQEVILDAIPYYPIIPAPTDPPQWWQDGPKCGNDGKSWQADEVKQKYSSWGAWARYW